MIKVAAIKISNSKRILSRKFFENHISFYFSCQFKDHQTDFKVYSKISVTRDHVRGMVKSMILHAFTNKKILSLPSVTDRSVALVLVSMNSQYPGFRLPTLDY